MRHESCVITSYSIHYTKLYDFYEDGREELYNLKTDLSEQNDVASVQPEKVKQLSTELFAYLKSVNAKYPVHDPLYDAAKEKAYLQKVATDGLKRQEMLRMKLLSKDFDPKNNWWGSAGTKD